eukprot:1158537-Pelagomonas_calceolata.AAC.28
MTDHTRNKAARITCMSVSRSTGLDRAGVPVNSMARLARCSSGKLALVRWLCSVRGTGNTRDVKKAYNLVTWLIRQQQRQQAGLSALALQCEGHREHTSDAKKTYNLVTWLIRQQRQQAGLSALALQCEGHREHKGRQEGLQP